VKCLPLSVSTSSGTPNSTSAAANAAQTARPVGRATTAASTQNRDWSSTPVTTLHSHCRPGCLCGRLGVLICAGNQDSDNSCHKRDRYYSY
jgi:hypothetical protein